MILKVQLSSRGRKPNRSSEKRLRNYDDVRHYTKRQLVKDLNESHGKIRELGLVNWIEGAAIAALWAVVLTFLKVWLEHR